MIKTCRQCGAVNGDSAEICCFCDAPLGYSGRTSVARRAIAPTESNVALEPEWRREVSDRLHAYQVRRHGGVATDLQSALPFDAAPGPAIEEADPLPSYAPPGVQLPLRRRPRTERVEISIPKREIAYPSRQAHRPAETQPRLEAPPNGLFPVAKLGLRRKAAMLDVGLLLFSYGGMLALFWALGGRIGFDKLDAVVTGATLVLFYAQYFALFTVFGGSTPGMMLCRLRVLSFDGSMPTSRQMVWRSLGYLISVGSFFVGFLWALWDEDHLCWQDRLSRTYLTLNEDLARGGSSTTAPRE